jgi:hypothetical protein
MGCLSVKPWRVVLVAGLFLLGAGGCGARLYPVRGKVTFADGKPVSEGMVVFESKSQENPITARGELRADGSYELSTYQPGDGTLPGKYRALVVPKSDPNAVDKASKPPPFAPRYTDFRTSGLEFDVTEAGPNHFPIQVDKYKKTP